MTTAPQTCTPQRAESCPEILTATYRRLTGMCGALRVRVVPAGEAAGRPGSPWTDGERLAAEPAWADVFIAAEAARVTDLYGHEARRDVAATRWLHQHLWTVCLLMSGPWYLERRVARIRPRDVRLDPTTGETAVVPGSFSCLAGDPAAHLTGTRVVVDDEALRAELRAAVADYARPLLAALGSRLRRGPRALWGMVADDLVSGIWHLGVLLGDEQSGVAAASALLPTAVAPFPGGAAFRDLTTAGGERQPTRTRLGCCLHYKIRSEETCITCPRTCDAERLRRLQD
ncbi:(2Fe-2S)-binding protein [Streptomyces meridianus]|uniref:(2Fe-2S)-binding protein n=1 Tax=Streptomyces meridianus TaxID=2938945 RepID=A0ABT0XCE8_9ACTN|nr:(2Fe-2S)-binding protein [Streptomyces meridianus]MCM2579945.1 (2Fe-2S)-binding protein [Streptomyces meridianus]